MTKTSQDVKEEALRLIRQGGVETRGRKPKDFDPNEHLPGGSIPWKVYEKAFKTLLPRGVGVRKVRAVSINEIDVLGPMRAELTQERVHARRYNNISQGRKPYPHLEKGATQARLQRQLFLFHIAACIGELSARGTRVSTKSVMRALSLKGIEAGITTTQRAIREIRLGLPQA